MTNRFRKILSILCALALLLTCAGIAFATEEPPEGTGAEVTDVDFPEGDPSGTQTGETGEPAADPEPAPAPAPDPVTESNSKPEQVTEPEPAPEPAPEPEPEQQPAPESDSAPEGDTSGDTTVQDTAEPAEAKEDPQPAAPAEPAPAAEPAEKPAESVQPEASNQGKEEEKKEEQEDEQPKEQNPVGSDLTLTAEEQDEDLNEEQEDESEDEPADNLLNLNGETTIEGELTKETPFTFTASDDYYRTVVFTLTVPEEDSVTVTYDDKPIELTKAENPDPTSTKVLYTFEMQLKQNTVYSFILTTEKDETVEFTVDITEKVEVQEQVQEQEEQMPGITTEYVEDTSEIKEDITDETDSKEDSSEIQTGENSVSNEDNQDSSEAVQEIAVDASDPVEEVKQRSVTFEIIPGESGFVIGSTAHFVATLVGYDDLDYSLQWQYSSDYSNWMDIIGETNETMDIVITEENRMLFWRINVNVLNE